MLNAIIRFALQQRLIVVACSLFLIGYGGWTAINMDIDVFPNLNRPRVVVMTEAHGMAPEEVEALITFPLETALNGATGVQAVRSSSGVGISAIYVEFDWGTDIYNDRQIVNERLQLVSDRLPPGVTPQLAPISSIMGQIMMIGMWSEGGKTSPMEVRTLADWVVRQRLLTIPGVSQVFTMGGQRKQFQVLVDPDALLRYGVTLRDVRKACEESNENATGGYLDEQGPNEFLVRSLGRVQNIEDLTKVVVTIRSGRPVLLSQVASVIEGSQVKRGDSSAYVRKAESGEQRAENRKKVERREPRVQSRKNNEKEGGDANPLALDSRLSTPDSSSLALRSPPSALGFSGGPAVVLTINKQPDADTRQVTDEIIKAIKELQPSLPDDIRIEPELYSQKAFIDRAIANVIEALEDGGILVVIILFLFLMNFRTTFITLTAIPLSIVITALVFTAFGLSINTMTLGGLAVAIGELVDDAIVDVENIFRRLRENRHRENPKNALLVIFQASVEIRNSIVFGTMIVVLVFLPLFALSGMEGRLFAPLSIAYIASILSSLLVSLTLTPVLCYLLLAVKGVWEWIAAVLVAGVVLATTLWGLPALFDVVHLEKLAGWFRGASITDHLTICLFVSPLLWALVMWVDRFQEQEQEQDGFVLRFLKWVAGGAIGVGVRFSKVMLVLGVAGVAVAMLFLSQLERDFLPPFNEGSVQLNVILTPGTSLRKSDQVAETVMHRLMTIEGVAAVVRRTGRAELDEHAEGVNKSEIIIGFAEDSTRGRGEVLEEIREAMADIPGIVTSVEQPIAHLISHMLSGVKAQVGIKIYGDDLSILRSKAQEMAAVMREVPGVKDLLVEPQVEIPQLRIQLDRDMLVLYGLTPAYVNDYIETAMNGQVVSQVLLGQRTFDLLIRMDEDYRENLQMLERLSIDLPTGGTTPLSSVAKIYKSSGPNTINRERVRRRIVIQCNVGGRGLVDVVEEIQQRQKPVIASLPSGYFVEYGGQFQSQQRASRVIGVLFVVSLFGVFMVLYTMFRSVNFSLQVMVALPMAFIGSVAALVITGQTLTVAAMVGFISLGGIASRNGILLLNHYIHLVKYEGEKWSQEMIIRAGKERLAPVLMTALTSGIGLVPLALAAGEPGKEILYPVATVIIGGLLSSTLLEFLVRPALFWTFGRQAGERVVATSRLEVPLVEESEESQQSGQTTVDSHSA